jgi:hypothetical protein
MRRGPADGRSYKGRFVPKNLSKYIGNPTNIVYRSSWELKLMEFLDSQPNVLKWCSEEVVIPYYNPVDGKMHRYFMDFFVLYKNAMGQEVRKLIEVKPYAQTIPPKKPLKMTKSYKRAVIAYATNQAKWKAARLFCEQKDMIFDIFTEYHLGIKELKK